MGANYTCPTECMMTRHPGQEHEGFVERACKVMHDAYERAATETGWETQQASRKPWADVPATNKATMRAAVNALLEWLL